MISDRHAGGLITKPVRVAPSEHARPRARFVLDADALEMIYPPDLRREIGDLVTLAGEPVAAAQIIESPSLLSGVDVLFSGWAAPRLTERVLAEADDLRVIFYGAGGTDYFLTDAVRRRGIRVTSAIAANSIPVAEFTMAQIVMCLKRVWQHVAELRADRDWQRRLADDPGASGYGSRIGLISLGEIGWRVAQRLAQMEVEVLVYDIHHRPEMAREFGFRYAGLEEVFATCDVVSLHTPLMPETTGMIDERLLRSMKAGASLINTARGAIIDQRALVSVLRDRPDLLAVLDVTDPEPPMRDDPLWSLPNAVVTPHIAGSRGRECERMGRWMLEELKRYLAGEPLRWEVV